MKVITLEQLGQAQKDYLDSSSVESDGFLEGLDVTEEAARELFKDFLIYTKQCEELYCEARKEAFIVVTHYWEDNRYLQRGKTFDGFATPQEALTRLMEEMSKGYVCCKAECLDEDNLRNTVWTLNWEGA